MGRIYVNQHPHDVRLTLDELLDMVGRDGEALPRACILPQDGDEMLEDGYP